MKISLTEQVIWRFIVSGLYSALSVLAVGTYFAGIQTWEQFQSAAGALAAALIIGFVNGFLMALHKYFTGATIPLVSTFPEGLVE